MKTAVLVLSIVIVIIEILAGINILPQVKKESFKKTLKYLYILPILQLGVCILVLFI